MQRAYAQAVRPRDRATAKTAIDLDELWHEHLKTKKERAIKWCCDIEAMKTDQRSSDEEHVLSRRLL
jgi:hypothetical protein